MKYALWLSLLAGCGVDPPMPEVFDGEGTVSFACAPDDGPAVRLEVGLVEAGCDAAPADTQRVVMTVYGPSFPLPVGEAASFTDVDGGFGSWYSGPEDTVGQAIDAGTFTILEDGEGGLRTGGYTFTRADGAEFEGGFTVVDCNDGTICG